ncbi:hypothetical protein [Dactylosporangium sp. NPDC049140]|uniref:hypothetical protein n=1 Tax=Dactylosporangium sp. NPDC049140 TaxID=3155647 RepID=UPI0033DC7A05
MVALERLRELHERLDGVAALEPVGVDRGLRDRLQDRAAVRGLAAVEAQARVGRRAEVMLGRPREGAGGAVVQALHDEVVALAGQVLDDGTGGNGPTGRGKAVDVEAPVGGGVAADHRGGRARAGRRHRGEAGEPGREVDLEAEPVGRPGQLDRLGLQRVALVRVAAQEPRRERLHVDGAAGQVEAVEPDHAGAAVVAVLVVGDVHVHVVAGVVAQHGAPRRPEVPVEGEEDLVVALDEPVPQPLAVVRQVRLAVVLGPGQLVGGEDDRQRPVLVEHGLRPRQALVRHPPVEGQDQPLPPGDGGLQQRPPSELPFSHTGDPYVGS